MNFKNFVKDKILQIILIVIGLFSIEILLICFNCEMFLKIYIPVCILVLYMFSIILEYFSKKKFYNNIIDLLNNLEEKYLIAEIIGKSEFEEGRLLKEILEQTDKAMIENVNKYKYLTEDYKEYIELWIHEVKMPIATGKMIIENNKNEVTKKIDEEFDKIENYTEQALFYARSNVVSQDYYIKKCNLQDISNEVIIKNKSNLIGGKISVNMHDLDFEVNTDSKWIVFILNQIIQNSIKYRKDSNSEIEIYSKKGKENIVLYVRDNGIGIKKGEEKRVFDKGFTGTNGRMASQKSTGIGLYLSKKLCDKLGISIDLKSEEGKFTEISLIFPQNSYNSFN